MKVTLCYPSLLPGHKPKYGLQPLACLMMLALAPREVHAYIGPGAGFTVVATGLVTLAVALIVVVGLLWYPIELLRRAIARRSGRTRAPGGDLASERSTRTP